MGARSSIQNGWFYDKLNDRLEFYFRGTKVGHLNASGFSVTDGTTARMTNGLVQAAGLGANLKTGYIPLPLTAWRLITTNDIGAIAVASGNGGTLASDTAPKLIRVNTSTDKQLRIQWASSGVIPITIQFALPPDVDLTASVTFKALMSMGGASDTPTVGVVYLENGTGSYAAATSIGGNTAAVTGTSLAVYSRAVTATQSPAAVALELTPAAHGTDVLNLFASWIEYQRKS